MAEREYLTIAEAARALGLPIRTLQYRLLHGLMRGERVNPRLWLIPRAEVDTWKNRGRLQRGRKPRSRRQ